MSKTFFFLSSVVFPASFHIFFSNIKNKHTSREEDPALATMAECRGFVYSRSMVLYF